eukprot:gene1350-2603_t
MKSNTNNEKVKVKKSPIGLNLSGIRASKPNIPHKQSNPTASLNTKTAVPGNKQHVDSSKWNFKAEYNDHFETPSIAYQDILEALQQTAESLQKPLSELIVYDPYYCQGNMVSRLQSLGIVNVINRNRDFYADINKKTLPVYDILVTNPPFSGEHKQRLLLFLTRSPKPFALLLPAYTATKSYWKEFIASSSSQSQSQLTQPLPWPSELSSSSESKGNKRKLQQLQQLQHSPQVSSSGINVSRKDHVLYVMPPDSYEYCHPEGTGKDVPPFYSCWFLGGFQDINSINRLKTRLSSKKAVHRNIVVLDKAEDLVTRGYVTDKRPNPKRRKKMKMMNSK